MLLPVKIICPQNRQRRDGTTVVYIQYCYSAAKKVLLNTKMAIPAKYWNDDKQIISSYLPEEYGDKSLMNNELKRMTRNVQDIIKLGIKMKVVDRVRFVKSIFTPEFEPQKLKEIELELEGKNPKVNLELFFQIDDYIQSKIRKVCKDMPRVYNSMKDHLKAFETFRGKSITFGDLDLTFYEEFVEFLMYDYKQRRRKISTVGLKINTIGRTIKQFRIFLRDRIRKRIIPLIDMEGWKILEEEVDSVYLTWKEINLIYQLDLTTEANLSDYRNDFVLGCLTGLRFSDFSNLSETDIIGDLLRKKQQKSDHWVVIPLRNEAKSILAERFRKKVPMYSNAEFNRNIKSLAKLAGINQLVEHSYKKGNQNIVEIKPKYKWVTSHTCRRSFCTNEFLAGTPVELIMKISGHKSVKDFYKYIRIMPEEAAMQLKELWDERSRLGSNENLSKNSTIAAEKIG